MPLFHYVVLPIFLINLILAIYRIATGSSFETAWGAVVACALIMIGFFVRVFALALLHESELARTDPDPQFLHRPMRYDIGLPSPVI